MGATPSPRPPLPPFTRHRRLPWAQLLRRSFKFDILSCGKCGGRRRVLAYISEPSVVRAILVHLNLPSTARPRLPVLYEAVHAPYAPDLMRASAGM